MLYKKIIKLKFDLNSRNAPINYPLYFYTWSNLELWTPKCTTNSNNWCLAVILAEDSHNFPPQFIASRECRSFSHMRFSHAMEFEYTNDENYSLTGYNANKCAQTQKMATIVIG